MRAVDTNVLVRLITRDDPAQSAAAEAYIARGVWVSLLALAETSWVLSKLYGVAASRLAAVIEMMLEHAHLSLQDPDVVARALVLFRSRQAPEFSDCLLLEMARKAGHLPLGTFDKRLAWLDDVERL
jgi:predicted nucleic-acid-binding protein